MISPDAALARLLALGIPVEVETVPLIEAAGRWTAEPVHARRTQPARDLSAMDGYAIRFGDAPGPWRVVGESAAGAPFDGTVNAGQAVRIFTGAALPNGADTIIIQEDVRRDDNDLHLSGDPPERMGAHVRTAGSDFLADDVLIPAGTYLTPARIGLAAIGGHSTLPVRRTIRVALVSTGNELVPIGNDPGEDRLPASNAVMLATMLADTPVTVTDAGIIPDDQAALTAAFTDLRNHDIIVTTGGASVGDHDLVQPALIEAGATIDFWKIAMRPGKPLMAGTLGSTIVLGLPGNPVSAFVTATLFLKPLIAHLSGASDPAPPRQTARLGADMPAVSIRTDYVRGFWKNGSIRPLGGDSGMLVPLAQADALIIRPAGAPAISAGTDVEIISLA